MRINHNIMALNTHRQLNLNNASSAKAIEKLSSGYRINRAGDDAAGLSISEKMRAQIRGLDQASRNSQDSISLIQTAEGALNETQSILQRMRELAVQSANDTNVSVDRDAIQDEMTQLTSEINRIGNTTEFNTMNLLDGSRAIETSDTVTTTTSAVSGTFTANFTESVNNTNMSGDGNVFKDGKINIAATVGDPATSSIGAASAASTTSSVKITKTSVAGTYKIDVNIKGTAGATVLSSTETIKFKDGEDFVYDNHGISFTVEASELSKFTATNSSTEIEFGSSDLSGTVATTNDWSSNGTNAGSSVATITSGFTFKPDETLKDAVKAELVLGATSATITYKDANSTVISVDSFTISAGGTYNYDAQGMKFTLVTDNVVGTASITVNFDTEDKNSTKTTVTADNSLTFQVGSNESQVMGLALSDMRAQALGLSSTTAGVKGEAGFVADMNVSDGTSSTGSEYALDVSTSKAAQAAITTINNALESVSGERAKLGAVQNRLEHTIKNLDTSAENLQASESRIRDVDMAKEMMEYTKNNILQQAAQAMLAQANQAPQGVLQLLR